MQAHFLHALIAIFLGEQRRIAAQRSVIDATSLAGDVELTVDGMRVDVRGIVPEAGRQHLVRRHLGQHVLDDPDHVAAVLEPLPAQEQLPHPAHGKALDDLDAERRWELDDQVHAVLPRFRTRAPSVHCSASAPEPAATMRLLARGVHGVDSRGRRRCRRRATPCHRSR